MKDFFESMTWVGWLNILLFQWMFFRLSYQEADNGRKYDFAILYWILPLSGWWGSYCVLSSKVRILRLNIEK